MSKKSKSKKSKSKIISAIEIASRKTGISKKELLNLSLEAKHYMFGLISIYNWPFARITRLFQNAVKNNATFESFLKREFEGCIRDRIFDNE